MEASSTFNILFQGPRDESPDTLRRLKGVFIAELNCSIDEVRRYLEEAPAIVFSTDEEHELQKTLKILEEAGAIVEILGENLKSRASTPAEDSTLGPVTESHQDAVMEFTFELDDFAVPEKVSTPKVYTLDLEEEPLQDELVASLLEEEGHSKSDVSPQFTFEDSVPGDETSVRETSINLDVPRDIPEQDQLPELDLTLSFDDELSSLPELHDKPIYDPFVAGAGGAAEANWELKFDAGVELDTSQTVVEEPSTSDLKGVEPEEDEEKSGESVLFDFEEDSSLDSDDSAAESYRAGEGLKETQDSTDAETPFEESKIVAPASALPDFQNNSQTSITPLSTPVTPPETRTETPLHQILHDSNTEPAPTRAKHRIAKIVGIGSIGTLLLALNGYLFWSNFLYPAQTVTVSDESLDAMIQATVKQQQQEKQAAKAALLEEQAAADSLKKLSGSTENEYGKFWFDFIIEKGLIASGDIIFSSTPPPPPTKIQLARGETAPWVHNAEFGPLRFQETVPGESSARGPIRLYIEQGKVRFREIGFATVIIQYDASTELIAGELVLSMKEGDQVRDEAGLDFQGDRQAGFLLSGRIPFSAPLTSRE